MAMVPMIGDPLARSGPRRGTTATAGVAFALFVLIEIPFPQRDLHVRSAPALESLQPAARHVATRLAAEGRDIE